jgi:hypothetical protein
VTSGIIPGTEIVSNGADPPDSQASIPRADAESALSVTQDHVSGAPRAMAMPRAAR